MKLGWRDLDADSVAFLALFVAPVLVAILALAASEGGWSALLSTAGTIVACIAVMAAWIRVVNAFAGWLRRRFGLR